MAKQELIIITLPKSMCKICKKEFYTRDMESHMQIVHGSDLPVKQKSLADIAKETKQQAVTHKKWHSHKYEHATVIHALKKKADGLPNDIKLQALQLDMEIAQIKSEPEFERCVKNSVSLATLIKTWAGIGKKPIEINKVEPEKVDPETILEQGRNILRMVRGSVITNPESTNFLNSVLGPNGFLNKAKSYLPLLKLKIHITEYTNNLELIERIANEKIADSKKPIQVPIPPKKKKATTPAEHKQQYSELLKKTMIPILAHLEDDRKKRIAAIHAYLKANSTSVFTYTYNDETGEVTGTVPEMASVTESFKI